VFDSRQKLHRLIFALSLYGLELTGPRPAAAGSLTVCRQGCDSTTVQGAIDAAQRGDVIRVQAGTYAETVRIDKDLTIEGEPSARSIIDGDRQATVLIVSADARVSISNLTMINGTGSARRSRERRWRCSQRWPSDDERLHGLR